IPGGLIVVCKFRLVKSDCLRKYPYLISWYQREREGVSVALTDDKNDGDKNLSDLLKGIDNITTMLQSLTTRVEHTEAELKELRQIQEGRGGDDEFGSFTLRQPHNQPTFQHQRPPQPHNHSSQRRQTTPQLQRPPPLHQQHPRQQYPLKSQYKQRFQQLNPYNDDDDETSGVDFEGIFEADHEPVRQQHQRDDFRLKVDLPFFNGNLNIFDFLDWIAEVERFFEFVEITENKQVKLIAYRSSWWEQVQNQHRRVGKQPTRSWPKMKRMLMGRFLPPDYDQFLFEQYQSLRQGQKSVADYTAEFLRLSSRNNLMETEGQKISSLSEARNIARRPESMSSRGNFGGEVNRQSTTEASKQPLKLNVVTSTSSNTIQNEQTEKEAGKKHMVNPYVRPTGDKCY
ncbi:uncharacterized protein Tco_1387565, partial [Tanacetum coccineum]